MEKFLLKIGTSFEGSSAMGVNIDSGGSAAALGPPLVGGWHREQTLLHCFGWGAHLKLKMVLFAIIEKVKHISVMFSFN